MKATETEKRKGALGTGSATRPSPHQPVLRLLERAPHPRASPGGHTLRARCQQVGVGVKRRPGLPVSPLFIYHQSPPTTEKSMLNWITDNGVERQSEDRSQLHSLLPAQEKLNHVKWLCVCCTISQPLKMQQILITNNQ